MSNRTAEAEKAIRDAWKNEKQLVLEGKGTRNWSPEQQINITEKGKAYDENGKAFRGHHMKSAEAYPEYQGDAENIQFLSISEHSTAHNNGNFTIPTNGYFDPITGETKDFSSNKYEPCKIIGLSTPITVGNCSQKKQNDTESVQKAETKIIDDSAIDHQSNDNISKNAKNKINFDKTNKIGINNRPIKSNPKRVKTSGKDFFNNVANFFGFESSADFGRAIIKKSVEFIIYDVVPVVIEVGIKRAISKSIDNSSKDKNRSSTNSFYPENNLKEVCMNTNEVSQVSNVERSSPRENIVPEHSQRYGKEKKWKVKAPYTRSKKSDE